MNVHQNIHIHATDTIALSPVCDAVDIDSGDHGNYLTMHVKDPAVADRMARMWEQVASRMRKRYPNPDPVAESLDREQVEVGR